MSKKNNLNEPILLSQAQKIRRGNDISDKSEISEALLRKIISEYAEKSEARQELREKQQTVVLEEIKAEITRLKNSMNLMANQFESFKNGDTEDAALRVTTDSEASDLALANVSLNKEDMYPYFCQDLANKLDIRKHDVLQMIKNFKLRNDDIYHSEVSISTNKKTPKWSESTYQKLKEALENGEYPRPNELRGKCNQS